MKMENLLKCEQVLVNLYKKVEQRDSLPISQKTDNLFQKEKSDLNTVRNKLKSVVSKMKNEIETLPEIARASETEEVCVPGSKEPALFQRRPNKLSTSPTHRLNKRVEETLPQMSKRNYTRVLLSPESNEKNRSTEHKKSEKALFTRRSPSLRSRKYHIKERRNSSKSKTQDIESQDLNITLNVPEENLDSLNTKDILSRIINCNDSDVDIDKLRELHSQILGELKDTGTTEDISDLILKSYKRTNKKGRKNEDIEEGEVSDSESEAIDSIYGSLLKDKDRICLNESNKISSEENQRKIKICLVFDSDLNKRTPTKQEQNKTLSINKSVFETYVEDNSSSENKKACDDIEKKVLEESKPNTGSGQNLPIESDLTIEKCSNEENKQSVFCEVSKKKELTEIEITKPNFYKPILEEIDNKKYLSSDKQSSEILPNLSEEQNILSFQDTHTVTKKTNVDIPLLETTKNVSEIDILQALKKEILSETHSVLSSDEITTPPLHQPKLSKVIKACEIGSKKRISIENYKAKSNAQSKNTPKNETSSCLNKDDVSKKNSLKLTEKECERFNFLSKITLDESSEEEDETLSVDELYDKFAPQSPDHEDFADTGVKPPVIIPIDPIQTLVSSEADVDMRKDLSDLNTLPENITSHSPPLNVNIATNKSFMAVGMSGVTANLTVTAGNLPPSMTPNMLILPNVGNAPNMTPNVRSYDMTTSRQIIDNNDFMNQNNVLNSPMSSIIDKRDLSEKQWDDSDSNRLSIREDPRSSSKERLIHPFPTHTTPIPNFGRMDAPMTPVHPYGRLESQMIPNHPFSRLESSTAQNYPFGRTECLTTTNHPYGRTESPATPNHNFGLPENLPAPNNSFNRSEPLLPTPFAKSNFNQHSQNKSFVKSIDPRLIRTSDFENYHNHDDVRDRSVFQEHKFNSYKSDSNRHNNPDFYRRYQREKSVGRSERNKGYDYSSRSYRYNKQKTNKKDCNKPNKLDDSRSLNEEQKTHISQGNVKYLPRKNDRDPRMRRENSSENKSNYRDDGRSKSRDSRVSGIVYSNDNITNGTILGPGCSVKNYKIPKIKRPQVTEEKDEDVENKSKENASSAVENQISETKNSSNKKEKNQTNDEVDLKKFCSKSEKGETNDLEDKYDLEKSSVSESSQKTTKNKVKDAQIINKSSDTQEPKNNYNNKEIVIQNNCVDLKEHLVDDNVEKRTTRSANKNLSIDFSLDNSPIKCPKRAKKSLIYDSDSDDNDKKESNVTSEIVNFKEQSSNKTSNTEKDVLENKEDNKTISTESLKISNIEKVSNRLDTGFGIDDLEIFSDSIATDPVSDNISALIADLDQDLGSPKTADTKNDSTTELTLGTMVENISSTKEIQITSIIGEELPENLKTKVEESVNSNTQSDYIMTETNSKVNVIQKVENNKDKDLHIEENPELTEIQSCKKIDVVESDRIDDITTRETPKSHKLEENLSDESIVSTSQDEYKLNVDSMSQKVTQINVNLSIDSAEPQRNLPDSTNDLNNDTNNVITSSTQNTTDTTNDKNVAEPKVVIKNKINEIFSLLGEKTGKNSEIKRMLEKISEIFSDHKDEENILEEQKTDSSELQFDKSDNTSSVSQQKHDREDSSKDNSSVELFKQSIEEEKVASFSMTENDNEIICGANDDVIIKDKVHEKDTESAVLNDKTDSQVEVITSEETQTTAKNIKIAAQKKSKKKTPPKVLAADERRLTRSDVANLRFDKPVLKKPSRELQNLHDDLREMFIRDDVLNATGIRTCRLAKLVDDKVKKDHQTSEVNNQEPVVILENITEESSTIDKLNKKKTLIKLNSSTVKKLKTKIKVKNFDIDLSDTDSVNGLNNLSDKKESESSESENESVSSFRSVESTDARAGLKIKIKRKRMGWQNGVIKRKYKKKKMEREVYEMSTNDTIDEIKDDIKAPHTFECYTDKSYCFDKNLSTYDCRLCSYKGEDIVLHYKKQHPHSEIPLSRLSESEAIEAIKESVNINFQALSKVSPKKYTCRFCFKEFGRDKAVIGWLFWHIISYHTGEYKQLCTQCLNDTRCPSKLDIPAPPKDDKGQLLGYICEKCNFTQVSLENIKTHIIQRHNDDQIAVHTINISVPTKNVIKNLLTKDKEISTTNRANVMPRVLRSSRSVGSIGESSDPKSDTTDESLQNCKKRCHESTELEFTCKVEEPRKIQSKIIFETDNTGETSNLNYVEVSKVKKTEPEISENSQIESGHQAEDFQNLLSEKSDGLNASNDICIYPHFKIKYSESGSKEYICCINGNDLHYRTTLLISLKKHVQLKHSEKWDGYCFICKVIVTPQGVHLFKDCLQHFLDQHIDGFPILEGTSQQEQLLSNNEPDGNKAAKTFINVRPLSQLISPSSTSGTADKIISPLPVIENVISLGTATDKSNPSPSYPTTDSDKVVKQYRYEEFQTEVMSRKHSVVLEAMLSKIKLVQVFKCSGRFCSFTTNDVNDALLHASTHNRIGGEDSFKCAYCDFDCSNNAIDLITHVFKSHGCCQYVCGMCFYRAAASQLVQAHIKRIHPTVNSVKIFYTALQTAPIQEDKILSREDAVPHYICCASSSSDAPCKFRTFTRGKFKDHLQLKHQSATEHSCFMCPTVVSKSDDLVQHLKTHGINLYQCTWCIFGADNETELLEHASEIHPDKLPKAYLRIITKKEGTSEFRVLPLAHLHKIEIPAEEVKSSTVRENPVREAERSIDLEKLIVQTTRMVESIQHVSETETIDKTNVDKYQSTCKPLLDSWNSLDQPDSSTVQHQEKSMDGSEKELISDTNIETAVTSEVPLTDAHVVYCLDSDEEEAGTNVTNVTTVQSSSDKEVNVITVQSLSDKEVNITNVTTVQSSSDKEVNVTTVQSPSDMEVNVTTVQSPSDMEVNVQAPKILLPTQLFLCSKCSMTFKYGAVFKKHVMSCFAQNPDPIPCAHCSMMVNKNNIVNHYTKTHAESARNYTCPKCPSKIFTSLAQVRDHERSKHSLDANSSNVDKAAVVTCRKIRSTRKRQSVNKEEATEPQNKIKKYGPQDVSLLPINPILDHSVFCSLCGFSTKVRLNMVRHLQLHADQQIVPQTAPVNPVPHLQTNEKHFDKMVNLASSSLLSRTPEKKKVDSNTTITLMIPPEAVPRYPKFIPEKHRHTCGAKGCSYISVDEDMFKCHWETLHSGISDYSCVHCPMHQHLYRSEPLTAARIITHLKMHNSTLYACSLCSFYHYRRNIVEIHLSDAHNGGQVMVVREEGSANPVNPTQTQISAPTMDLKPWLCGLCDFKSLLRLEVVDHCTKIHNSKMQYKCAYCTFQTSNADNVTKHQSKSHSDKNEEIFYYYYREDSVPQDPDGIPLWQKQSQECKVTQPTLIKSEVASEEPPTPLASLPLSTGIAPQVDLDLVKKEVIETTEETIEDLCKQYGAFCEPNGLKYMCSLCKHVEDTYDAMQSHLYEELKYRKLGCSICSYRALNKERLSVHMLTEHRQNKEPIALEIDNRVETWVIKLLEYQTEIIEKNKENLRIQKEELLRSAPGPSSLKSPADKEPSQVNQSASNNSSSETSIAELERLFGTQGVSLHMSFCCPKCQTTFKKEDAMRNHLEIELNKIRWLCTSCSLNFQTYHEAQFHCKSVHIEQSARPYEATRDLNIRSAWIESVIHVQKLSMNYMPVYPINVGTNSSETGAVSDERENSLLVVRYEERADTPDEQMAHKTPVDTDFNLDSDEEKLIIDETGNKKDDDNEPNFRKCPHCDYSITKYRVRDNHILRHYNLKPFTCGYCNYNGSRKAILVHQKKLHRNEPPKCLPTLIPKEPPNEFINLMSVDFTKKLLLLCPVCGIYLSEADMATHTHDKVDTSFVQKGNSLVKCKVCLKLNKNMKAYFTHHKKFHPKLPRSYQLIDPSVNDAKKEVCSNLKQEFNHMGDLKIHTEANHNSNLKNTMVSEASETAHPVDKVINLDDRRDTRKKNKRDDIADDPSRKRKRVAKKSTTKLSYNKSLAIISATKLPSDDQSEPEIS